MPENNNKNASSIAAQVADRIKSADNVLVALSKNPSVDDLSAALGLTFVLDKMGKHATAIFSGAVPNAIEFLEPEKTFEANTNSLQDFIIALDKEKADHLRYKIEGDYVKVYITPYRTTLSEQDLEFSHGEFNVDLVIALNVTSEADLDSALSEYGRIKHDASSINITASTPGNFADLEWGDPGASSVSEMIAHLAMVLDEDKKELVEKSTATALLAGIVSATKRFSNERTSAETMAVASDLMTAGADQQLISSSIPADNVPRGIVDINEEVAAAEASSEQAEKPAENELVINREEEKAEEPAPAEQAAEKPAEQPAAEPVEAPAPEAPAAPEPIIPVNPEAVTPPVAPAAPETPAPAPAAPAAPVATDTHEKLNITPPSEASAPKQSGEIDFAAEMAAELANAEAAPTDATPNQFPTAELPAVEVPAMPEPEPNVPENAIPVVSAPVVNEEITTPTTPPDNVAPFQAPSVSDPSIPPVSNDQAEYVKPPFPMPEDGAVLPPPPAPFSMDATPPAVPTMPAPTEPVAAAEPVAPTEPVMPEPVVQPEMAAPVEPITPAAPVDTQAAVSASVNGVNPVMQDQIYNDPNAFHIPGM